MARMIGLLRAVNVGGTGKLAMADLRTCLEQVGLSEVETLLQSGNVVFSAPPASGLDLETELERELANKLGLATRMILREATEWAGHIAANPFVDEALAAPSRLMMCPLKGPAVDGGLAALQASISGPERIALVGRALYVFYPEGSGNSKLDLKLIERKLGVFTTQRNWNTVLKLEALALNQKGAA